ncbi:MULTISPECIES: hypothetical protein [Clavibacter]|uniref:Uncharacterized protein n=3 Tax=Clavibacter TaxID=1573 RepID=A0A251YHT4_9MICO|nr:MULTISPECIES: hypothetical protein [Clavibacter]AJW80251.1 hypothetical protein VO01_15020 [Clavibacter michiganensis subsp. insidiosus]AWF99745.1 hypothetical protein BEH61_14660 [Clavibacter michiganensis subsp. insidiosus]AWG02848.1 hypothetical protein BEH62_14740 [Clavibacter michiganensis subsp. insidiosus]KDP91950.1 hypothetical protein W824_03040 [Clavibacter cf. michiganensis LMG 26808]MBF4621616.1 hypothetical protein [Clavibacter sp. VKM Ac-2542]
MTDSTYTAQLVGPDGTEETEVELINGEPVKSFVRATSLSEEEVVWELDADADGYVYRPAGIPGADYS